MEPLQTVLIPRVEPYVLTLPILLELEVLASCVTVMQCLQ